MADEETTEELPINNGPPPIMLRVSISSCRKIAENSSTVVSYKYPLVQTNDGDEPDESGLIAGSTEAFEEAPEGTENVYNFQLEHALPPMNEFILKQFIKSPLIFTIEGLPAEAKVTVPLTNLVWKPDPVPTDPDDDEYLPGYPGSFVQGWYKVERENPPESASDDDPFPTEAELFVKVTISELLGTEEELNLLNIMTITLHSMHQLPKLWHLQEGESNETHLYAYKLTYSLPGVGEVIIEPGEMLGAVVEEPPAAEEGEEQDGEPAPKPRVEAVDVDDVLEPLQGKPGRKVSTLAEKRGPRLMFNHTFETALRAAAVKELKDLMATGRWEIDVSRSLRDEAEYVYKRKYHGLAEVDLSGLIKPGEKSVVLRCPVGPAKDYARPTAEELEACPPPGDAPEEDEDGASPFTAAETYLLLEIATRKPLQLKPVPPKPVLPKVGDLIPTRPPPKVAPAALSAEDEFSKQVRGVVEELADEFAALFLAGAEGALTAESADARRKQMIYHLNASGKYYLFKERLKAAVARIVRDRFRLTSLDATSHEGRQLVSKLYVHLQELVNASLNRIFEAAQHKPAPTVSAEQLPKLLREEQRLAGEAETVLNYELAAQHLNQRIVLCAGDAVLWHDYGVMSLRARQLSKAEECLREALALDPRHVPSLLAFGVLLCLRERYADSETYFRGAVDHAPDDALAWALLVLLYDMESRDLDRRAALKRFRALAARPPAAPDAPGTPPPDGAHAAAGGADGAGGAGRSAYVAAADFVADYGCVQMVERAAAQELAKYAKQTWSLPLRLIVARAYLAVGRMDQCREHLEHALKLDRRCSVAMTLMGHAAFLEAGLATMRADRPPPPTRPARGWYEKALEQKAPYVDIVQYVRLGKVYLADQAWYEAKLTLLKACRLAPSATTWLGLGIACHRMGEAGQAEEALSEANILDNANAQVWGMLAVVCMARDKPDEAEQALSAALRLGIGTAETLPCRPLILEQAGQAFLAVGRYRLAEAALRRGRQSSAAPSLALALAEALELQKDTAGAIEVLQQLADGGDVAAASRMEAARRLVELCTRSKRAHEAAHYQALLNATPAASRAASPLRP